MTRFLSFFLPKIYPLTYPRYNDITTREVPGVSVYFRITYRRNFQNPIHMMWLWYIGLVRNGSNCVSPEISFVACDNTKITTVQYSLVFNELELQNLNVCEYFYSELCTWNVIARFHTSRWAVVISLHINNSNLYIVYDD